MTVDPKHEHASGATLDDNNVLGFGKLKLPKLKPSDVLVEVFGGPINPSDVYYTEGLYPVKKNKPTICGFEGSGIVVQTGGDKNLDWLLGQRVCYFGGDERSFGSWGDFSVMPGNMVYPLPEGLDLAQGSCCLVNPLTVEIFMKICEDRKIKSIVHTGAAGALGKMLIQACKEQNITLINIVRSDAQVAMLTNKGSQYVLNSLAATFVDDFAKLSRNLKPRAFFDAVGGQLGSLIISLMPGNSTTYAYGNLSREDYRLKPEHFLFKNIKLEGIWLSKWAGNPEMIALVGRAFERLSDGTYKTDISKEFHPHQIREALDYYAKNASRGKVLIRNPTFDQQKL